ncbi:MarR family transcriptional regulator [Actinoplanes sp. Pm04-4]|uniref:MarR family transcriptional regulator n=1 Tax=Paractinoplanes pyxinae TaxID=2997416 RepID=A0ABT4AR34_9ACTN|nr:MarR family transcriptional regulator [Actinoplanes pyxinae]MCY1136703.1 MarR family transcriptional regulator [Actinoplanes pyxinae]
MSDSLSTEEHALFDAFVSAAVTVQRGVGGDLQELNRTLSEYLTMRHLSEAPAGRLRIGELATAAFVSISRMSRIVEKLEHEGLVERETDVNDRRASFAVLTEAGRRWLREARNPYEASVRRHFLRLLDPGGASSLAATAHQLTGGATGVGSARRRP